jgi:hypothetical protein
VATARPLPILPVNFEKLSEKPKTLFLKNPPTPCERFFGSVSKPVIKLTWLKEVQ